METLDDRNLDAIRPLPSPQRLKAELPPDARVHATVAQARSAVRDLLHGRDTHRLLVVSGPCSIHDPDAALEYAERLAKLAERTRDALLVVMRTYFEKPRTTVGWKGLINDPHLDGSCDLSRGLRVARETLLRINRLGVACGGELLDPITPQYVADLLAWGAIGARTSESQTHRELASGVSMPVGFKNGTDGSIETARDAMLAAGHPHTFAGIDAEGQTAAVMTRGNPYRHLILRGGAGGPNYGPQQIGGAAALVANQGIPRSILVDCSHANSGKDPARQPEVCRQVLAQVRAGDEAILGVMLESNLETGRQDWKPGGALRRGLSITDGCIGWEQSEALIEDQSPRRRLTCIQVHTGTFLHNCTRNHSCQDWHRVQLCRNVPQRRSGTRRSYAGTSLCAGRPCVQG
jgi:3-deoxy-7-phosphoheptulonate synthase